jgi:hypothetical protein
MNLKSLYFNFKYFPFRVAIKLPVFVSRNVFLLKTEGTIEIDAPIETGMIKIGYGEIGIFDMQRSRAIWQVSGKVTFKGTANIGHGTKISVGRDAHLEVGRNFSVTAESEIVVDKNVRFGDDVLMSWNCLIMDSDGHEILDHAEKVINPPAPILIGNRTWIGCRAVVLKGSKIADGSIIGANSVLTKDISTQPGIYAGNPIRFIRGGVAWKA